MMWRWVASGGSCPPKQSTQVLDIHLGAQQNPHPALARTANMLTGKRDCTPTPSFLEKQVAP